MDVDIIYSHLPGDLAGLYDHETATIYLDPRCDHATQACTLEHELVHAERGDVRLPIPHLDAKQEELVERIASRRMVPIWRLAEVLSWTRDFALAAHELNVDAATLRKRLDHLTPNELAVLSAALDNESAGA